MLRALLDHVDEASRRTRRPGGVPSGQAAWQLLSTTQGRAPEAVEAVLADPTVMAWALRLLRRLGGSDAGLSSAPLWADLGQFHALAAAAALRAGVSCVLRVPAHRGMVWLPGAGMAGPVARRRWSEAEVRVDRDGAVVRGELGEVMLSRALAEPVPGWRPLRVVRGLAPGAAAREAGVLWLDVVSPYRDFAKYPKPPDRPADARLCVWEHRLSGAYALLDRESPADAAAFAALVRAVVPKSVEGAERGLVASASSLDAFGAITLSLPYDVTQTAAVLIHETRHQQLNALLSLVALVRPSGNGGAEPPKRRLHYSPWRSDPRPVWGLLHGLFAFVGVGRFWQTHRRHVTGTEAQRADFELAVLREQVREAVAALQSDELTEAGQLFVDEIVGLVESWHDAEVAVGPAVLAHHYCALRRAVWRARHLRIPAPVAARLATAWATGAAAPPLPPSTMHPRPDLIRPDTFGPLARVFLSAPAAFAQRRLREGRHGEPALRAEYAAVAGDTEEAALGYAEWAAKEPWNPETWIGAALALPEHARGAGAALLLERPEVVADVRGAVEAAGGGLPAPGDLAEWLGGAGA
ncbi:aKG-HExxH-type peptide beta-hydroxylase [Streptomyces sp. E11-3]|uniref:aKG-HExxH-type peptide beta-hydroxylase n=1 Tax=Streptomyces sp. E11-3 TaxID=3110112 RepID=UPI0039802DE4